MVRGAKEKLGDGSFLRLLDDLLNHIDNQDRIIQAMGDVVRRQDVIIEMMGADVDFAEKRRRKELADLIAEYERTKGDYV